MNDTTWGEPFMHWLLAWGVVITFVAAIVHLFRQRRASVCYSAWLLATFSGMVLLLVAFSLRPVVGWEQVANLWQRPPHSTMPAAEFQSWFAPHIENRAVLDPPIREDAGPSPNRPENAMAAANGPNTAAEHTPLGERLGIGWFAWSIWTFGMAFCLFRLRRSFVRARLLTTCGTKPDDGLAELFEQTRNVLGLRRQVQLLVHPEIPGPVCVGGRIPAVIWPATAVATMTPDQRRSAMFHELAHLRRYDDRINLAAELWRACCWFFLPVHWTITRLRREQEFLCDDLAASATERPEAYARMLLDMSSVRVRNDSLCVAMAGSAIKLRIRRLIDAKHRCITPMSRRQLAVVAMSGCALLLVAGSLRLVSFADTVDAVPESQLPEITLQALSGKMQEALDRYERGYLEATFEDERNANRFGSDAEPVMIQFPGRFHYASDGHRWRTEVESKSYRQGSTDLYPTRRASGFDGDVHFVWEHDRNTFVLGEDQPLEHMPISKVFFSSHGSSFPSSLAENDWQFQNQTVVNGYRCYLLTREKQLSYQERQELTISPRQGFLPVRYKVFADGKLAWSHELSDLEQSRNGTWFPRNLLRTDTYSLRTLETRVARFEPDRQFDDDYFGIDVPAGTFVRDNRTGRIHLTDPWWPQVGPIMRDQFDWPPIDLAPLREAASYTDGAIEGQSAPAIEATTWINGDAVNLEQFRGKVTLLYFSGGSSVRPNSRYTPALKAMYATLKPHGFEIVQVNANYRSRPDSYVARLRQSARELQVPWPVAVDIATQKPQSHGKTFDAYGMKTYLSPILVDHEGRVHLVLRGGLADDVRRLLISAGAEDVPPVSFDFINHQPDGMEEAVVTAWRQFVREAPKTATIGGQLIDGDAPLQGVNVRARLMLELSGSPHSASSTTGHWFRDRDFRAESADDGAFELAELCKGTYRLTFKLPGRATIERRIVVPDHGSQMTLNVSLDQGDTIDGHVVDDSGKPLQNALVTRVWHHHRIDSRFPAGEIEEPPIVCGADGRFRFGDLKYGAYTLQATLDGYEAATVERAPAGTSVLIVLRPLPK